MEEKNCNFYIQQQSNINNFHAWLYLIDSPIGNFFIVEWEDEGHGIHRKIFEDDYDGAERKYNLVCRKLLRQ